MTDISAAENVTSIDVIPSRARERQGLDGSINNHVQRSPIQFFQNSWTSFTYKQAMEVATGLLAELKAVKSASGDYTESDMAKAFQTWAEKGLANGSGSESGRG